MRTVWEKYRHAALAQGLLPWVFTILRNKVGNYLRRQRTERAHLATGVDVTTRAGGGLAPDGTLDAIELAAALTEAIEAMPDECRKVFRLLLSGANREQIRAAFAGTPMGTIDSRISRCRRRLLALLAAGPVGGAKP